MGFKLPGKSIQSGTSAHSSALKMVAEQRAASALKQKDNLAYGGTKTWAEGQKYSGKHESGRSNLDVWVGERKKYKKGSADYNKYQDKINEALGSKVRHTKAAPTTPKEKKIAKVEKSIVTATAKTEKIKSEKDEDLDVKTARKQKKIARIKHGKGSKEHLKAKKTHLQSKEADIQGKRGGKKRGIFRGLVTKISKKRQANIQKKIDETETPAKIYSKPKGKRTEY